MKSKKAGLRAKEKRKWRFIFTGKNDAFFNIALDEALLILCEEKNNPPVLRLYQWEPKAVSIGYSQSIERTVDLEKCRERNVDVVRRMTGGRAVLHDNDLTYSISASRDHYDLLGQSVNDTYKRISLAFLESLRILKIKGEFNRDFSQENELRFSDFSRPCFSSAIRYEIHVNGRKLIGSAQRRFKDSFIQQGSILVESGGVDLVELLPFRSQEQRQKLRASLENQSVCIRSLVGGSPNLHGLVRAVKSAFSSFFSASLVDCDVSTEELSLARALASKYRSETWTLRRQTGTKFPQVLTLFRRNLRRP